MTRPRTLWRGAACLLAAVSLGGQQAPARDYAIRAVPFQEVVVDDEFWAPKIEVNRRVSLPHIFDQNEKTGRIENFEKGAGLKSGKYVGRRFNDTDVYKAIEAAAYTLRVHPDAALQQRVDAIARLIAGSQQPDGYLYPARTIDPANPPNGVGPERWALLSGSHELYNAGHLYEAALAVRQATGSEVLWQAALKNAELVRQVFLVGGRKAVPGHQEIELALIKLYRETGDARYFDLAKHFLDERGKPHPDIAAYPDGPFAIYNDAAYRQDHVPVTQQATAVGHAVRATYLYSAMTDVAGLSGDTAYGAAVDRLWADVVAKRLYVTGGIGSRGVVEAFGEDYELPNRNAYTETCASIGNALWGHRMFLLRGEGRYVDVLERILYNGYLSGVSLGGTRFFYQNPLESAGESDRTDYFEVACCPSNLARMMAQLPGLIYARRGDDVFVNLFIGSRTRVQAGGASVAIAQTTRYPWDGTVRLAIDPDRPTTMALRVRVPGWSRNEALPSDLYRFAESSREAVALRVNGKGEPVTLDQGYLVLRRRWTAGDTVELRLPMPVRRLLANDGVQEDRGRVALQRGPLMYAVEGIDHAGHALNLVLPPGAPLATSFRAGLLGGVQVITGTARVVDAAGAAPRDVPMLAIPYYAWNNRGRGEMAVWIPTAPR